VHVGLLLLLIIGEEQVEIEKRSIILS